MTAPVVLGLWLAHDAAPATRLEAWRTLVAARAGGQRVRLLDLRTSPPAPPLPPEVAETESRLLDALEAEGAPLERPGPEDLVRALAEATSIVALASPARPGTPPVLDVEPTLLRRPPSEVAALLRAAGQIACRPAGPR